MKKFVVIGVTALFFIVLLILLLYKLLASPEAVPTKEPVVNPFTDTQVATKSIFTDTPAHTAATCYSWYLQVYARGASNLDVTSKPEAEECFTTSFMRTWRDTTASTGIDPVLLSQDIGTSWASSVSVSSVGDSIRTSDQRIMLGTGDYAIAVIAHIVRQDDGTWKIDSVSAE